MNGPLLRTGNIKDYLPLGEEGNPVYKWATQIRVAIKRKINPDSVKAFAIPQPNENGDIIDWYAPEAGSVIPWSAATREERISAKEQLTVIKDKLDISGPELQRNEDGEQSIFNRLLEHIIQFPDDGHVYLVDGKPVLTFWGFVNNDAGPRPDPLAILTIPELTSNAVKSIPVHANVVEVAPVKKRSFWWWLLPLLLLPLLLLFFLRGCEQPIDLTLEQDIVELPKPEEIPVEHRRDVVADGTNAFHQNPLSGDVASYENKENSPLIPEAADGEGEMPLDEPGIQEQSPELSPDSELDAESQADELDSPSDETDLQEPDEQEATAQEEPQETNVNPELSPLSIPTEGSPSQSMDFLNGRWQANSGLMDKQGRPVNLEYEFKDGKGQVKIKKNDGSVCSGAVDATMSGSGLTFSDKDVIKCQNGRSYQPAKVKCSVDANKQTVCEGSYSSGDRFNMDINKLP